MKHTKGKWEIEQHEEGFAIGREDLDYQVADVYGANSEEAQANAKLIAAAPDMLEALERVMRHFNNAVPGNCEGHNAITLNDFANARKAIKKATGNKG